MQLPLFGSQQNFGNLSAYWTENCSIGFLLFIFLREMGDLSGIIFSPVEAFRALLFYWI
jgi:hypothetical protein